MVFRYRFTPRLSFLRMWVWFLLPAVVAASCGPWDEASSRGSEALWVPKPGLVQTCGEIRFEVNGGSLVINGSVAVETTTANLKNQLLERAQDGPFRACLIGQWRAEAPSAVFRATSVLEAPIGHVAQPQG